MSGRRRRVLRGDEAALWQAVARSVTPLRRHPGAAEPVQSAAAQKPESPETRRPAAAAVPPAPAKPQPKPGPPPLAPLGRRLKQQIARGSHAIDARLDLHGLTRDKAHAALGHFLRTAQADGARLVLVITGKGGRSGEAEPGVLRREVPRWLTERGLREYVIGFDVAAAGHGGGGALYIRVRRRRS